MENKLIEVVDTFPTLIKNTHLNVNLQGWPAAVTAIAICCAGVRSTQLKPLLLQRLPLPREPSDVAVTQKEPVRSLQLALSLNFL